MMSRLSARVCAGIVASVLVLVTGCGGSSKKDPQVSTVALTADRASLAKGTSIQLDVRAAYDDNTSRNVTADATYTSADPAIVAIQGTRAIAKAVGATKISAALNGKSASIDVTVTPAEVVSVAMDKASVSLARGLSTTLKVTGTFTDASTQDVTPQATWTSTDGAVAAVGGGVVNALKEGSAKVKAFVGGQSSETAVTVTAATPTRISIDQANVKLIAGLSQKLTATGLFTDNTAQDVSAQVVWSSSDEAVVKVVDGSAQAIGAGTAEVTAQRGELSAKVAVQVVSAQLVRVEIEGVPAELPQGSIQKVKANGVYDNGNKVDLSGDVQWLMLSSAASINVAEGEATVRAAKFSTGDAILYAGYFQQIDSETKRPVSGMFTSVAFKVVDAQITGVTVAPAAVSLPAGLVKQFSATASYTNGTKREVTGEVAWSTSDPEVAVFGPTALLTALAKGDVEVTAKAANGVKGVAQVAVTDALLKSVTISPADPQKLPLGLTKAFTVKGVYTAGPDQDLTSSVVFYSDDERFLTISNAPASRGLASGIALGPTTVWAREPTTMIASEKVVVQVTGAVPVGLQIASVSPSSATVAKGTSAKLTFTAKYSDHTIREVPVDGRFVPTAKTADVVTFSSCDAGTALCAFGAGVGATDVEFVLSNPNDASTVSASAKLTVTPAELTSVEVSANPKLPPLFSNTPANPAPQGIPVPLVATGIFTDGSRQDLTKEANWTIAEADQTIARVSADGVVTGLEPGTALVTASATVAGITQKGTYGFTVSAATLTRIRLFDLDAGWAGPPYSFPKGVKRHLIAVGDYEDGSTVVQFNITDLVTWDTADHKVAAVNGGVVEMLSVGTTALVVTEPVAAITSTVGLTCTPAELVSLKINEGPARIYKGLFASFTAVATFTDGTKLDVTKDANWSSAVPAAVSPTTVKGEFQGLLATAPVAIAATYGTTVSDTLSTSQTVEVLPAILVRIEVLPVLDLAAPFSVGVDHTIAFKAIGTYTDGGTQEITQSVLWASSAPAVAQVSNALPDQQGVVTGLASGDAVITVFDAATRVTGNLDLVVTP